MLQYIGGKIDLVLKLSEISTVIVKWWIDTAYGVHNSMHSHTGTIMSLDLGSIYRRSSKHKTNLKSSTKEEHVGVSDSHGHMLLAIYFLKEQGYDATKITLYEDNASTECLENNGHMPSI